MAPKVPAWALAKARGEAKAKAKAKAKTKAAPASPSKPKAKAASPGRSPEPSSPGKRKAASPAASPPPAKIARANSSELLEKAKQAAVTGKRGKGGARIVDSRVPGREAMKVHEEYSVKLNQTHIDANNNKYYIIQVLESGSSFFAWNRWGRVGEDGQNKLMPCGASAGQAIKEFEKKFREKTCNRWEDRDNFKAVAGKYSIVDTEDAEGGGQGDAPMGKLTEAQIGKGQAVLEKIEKELQKKSSSALASLTSSYYTLVPQNFGRTRPPVISSNDMLQVQQELLKFYLRMGFEEVEADESLTPIDGIMNLPCPKTLDECGVGSSAVKSSNSGGSALAKKQSGKPVRTMGAALYAAILLYTSNAIYKDLNQCLRDEKRSKIKKYFKYLRLFLEAMACLPRVKRTLWRGLSVDLFDNPQYVVGSIVTWWNISSTTSDINVAKNFAKGCGGKCTVLTIESETSSDISEITFYSNEKESLLAPGTQLKVKSKKMNGNVCEIVLKEVGRVIG